MINPEDFMLVALEQAKLAAQKNEVPIGACIVFNNEVVAVAHNKTRELQDPTAHAEILAIQEACRKLGDWRLDNYKLFVTVEPCSMCAGAIKLSRISEIYFGASEPNLGAVGSLYNILEDPRTGKPPRIVSGILEEPCQKIIKAFFVVLR